VTWKGKQEAWLWLSEEAKWPQRHALAASVLGAELHRELGAGCDLHSRSGTENFWSTKLWL